MASSGWVVLLFSHSGVPDSLAAQDGSLPGSSVHGISQTELLQWVAIPFPGDLPDPGMEPASPALAS